MSKNPARNPKVSRRQRSTKAGPRGSLRRVSPASSRRGVRRR